MGRSFGGGNGNPLQCSCLENSRQRSLLGYNPCGCKESDMTERLTLPFIDFVVQFLSRASLFVTMDCSPPGFPVFHHHLEFAQIHVHWVGDAIQPFHPLMYPSPPAFNISQHQVFFRWPKYWSFSFSISSFNEYPGLISFMVEWFDVLQSKGLSTVYSNATIQKHQFFSTQP